MPFAPGQSGNPSGRSKESARIKALAASKAESAINKLANIMETSLEEKNVIAAANALLDRGIGKPAQSVTVGGDEENPVRTISEVLLRAVDATRD